MPFLSLLAALGTCLRALFMGFADFLSIAIHPIGSLPLKSKLLTVGRSLTVRGGPSPLRVFGLGLLLDRVKDYVPHLMRHDIIAGDVFHLHPMRLPLGDRPVIVKFFGYGLQVQ